MARSISIPLLYLVIGSLFIEIFSNIGMGYDEIGKYYIFGIPISDLALLVTLLIFAVRLSSILNSINISFFLFILVIGVFASIIGFLNSNQYTPAMNEDIRTYLWLFGGISFGYTLVETKNISFHLGLIAFIAISIIIISSISISIIALASDNIMDRISHPNLYSAAGLFFVPLILFICTSKKNLGSHIFIFLCILSFIYFVGILAATRSMLLIGILIFFNYYLLIKSNPNLKQLNKESLEYSSKRSSYFLLIVFIIFLTLFLFNVDASVIDRLKTIFDFNTLMSDSRVYELKDYFDQLSVMSIIFGEGFGGGVESTIYNGKLALTLHIGIMTYALKYGWFVFIIALFFYFILVPTLSIYFYYQLKSNQHNRLTYIKFGCLLSITPMILSLILSGGYSSSTFMMMGCVYYIYNNIDKVLINI